MSKKGKKDEQAIHVWFECDLCKATLIRSVSNEDLKETEGLKLREAFKLREQHIELHRLAEIGYKVREMKELANE